MLETALKAVKLDWHHFKLTRKNRSGMDMITFINQFFAPAR